MRKLLLSLLIIFIFAASAFAGPSMQTSSNYNPASVAITGGTVNGTSIGSTTPSTGIFTGLTGNGVYISVSTDLAITAAQMKGQVFVISGAKNPVLPAAATGLKGTFIADAANVFTLDVNATPGTDIIVNAQNPQAAGEKITSDGTAFAEVYCECKIAGKWICTPNQGLFINGGQ